MLKLNMKSRKREHERLKRQNLIWFQDREGKRNVQRMSGWSLGSFMIQTLRHMHALRGRGRLSLVYLKFISLPPTPQIPVEGDTPFPRHSHSACSYEGGVLVFGGLSEGGVPLGDTAVLRPTERGFCWEKIDVHPPPEPRYSHRAHVVEQKLLVVGGVWMFSEGVPGLAVIDLTTRTSMEFSLDTVSVPYPLMLHSFCSELTASEGPELLLIGGGGNCFSFGTHWNRHLIIVDLRGVLT